MLPVRASCGAATSRLLGGNQPDQGASLLRDLFCRCVSLRPADRPVLCRSRPRSPPHRSADSPRSGEPVRRRNVPTICRWINCVAPVSGPSTARRARVGRPLVGQELTTLKKGGSCKRQIKNRPESDPRLVVSCCLSARCQLHPEAESFLRIRLPTTHFYPFSPT